MSGNRILVDTNIIIYLFKNEKNVVEFLRDKEIYLSAYIRLCYKTIFLLSLVEPLYVEIGTSWNAICNEVTKCCYNGISKIDLNLTDEEKKALIVEIDEIIKKYRK